MEKKTVVFAEKRKRPHRRPENCRIGGDAFQILFAPLVEQGEGEAGQQNGGAPAHEQQGGGLSLILGRPVGCAAGGIGGRSVGGIAGKVRRRFAGGTIGEVGGRSAHRIIGEVRRCAVGSAAGALSLLVAAVGGRGAV